MESHTSSPAPKGLTMEQEIEYWKNNYAQMEEDLKDFQASSRELEAEMEKDMEASDKRERQLREKVDNLTYEVEEWKTKHRQAKIETNNAQNTLQKEITQLRKENRELHLKLRDIEVANDDYERQARHQTSSLEDLESKYNVGIERHVMLEEEVRNGEQERENLRIETQRLRDELSDLKIESDITHEKLRTAEETIERFHSRNPRQLATDGLRPPSPASEGSVSATTTASSPVAYTPPPSKSETSPSTAQTTPPSPPLSDASAKANRRRITNPITPARQRTLNTGIAATPKTVQSTIRQPPRHSRRPSVALSATKPRDAREPREPRAPPSTARRTTSKSSRPSFGIPEPTTALPRSGSLYQMSALRGKVQKLQERVQSVRSKLPAPTTTPPRASPRGSTLSAIPDSVTVRSGRKRVSNSTTGSEHLPVSRLSFGLGQSTSTRPDGIMHPPGGGSRPSSRASVTSAAGGANPGVMFARPQSRSGMSGARTPSFYDRRPRSSMSGSVSGTTASFGIGEFARSNTPGPRSGTPGPRSGTPGPRMGHGHSQSVSGIGFADEAESFNNVTSRDRRTTLEKGFSAIPTPSGLPVPRRQSGGASQILDMGRRQSNNISFAKSVGPGGARPSSRAEGAMPPPKRKTNAISEGGLGETF
ncbi:hypothetical protein EJ08DRAFT_610599 [Tothia fuscella]|uniref:NUDE domain-containing protein n=1 Tax=Tothia fuscella TaxID=1048955 RepID=A0A9P4TYM2_9PEZI|nr:hypothetical protein EJ08DRAFT_610599 [Tothia fuscella]